ncbi:hypothetical protein GLYMA_15G153200v4 [Glycine max]|uniref:Uncharacterized protein n=1 Tax=Glycine max TaxID=3847 RepID=K7MBH6_SOYBN|nr:hypothetical protein GYH30_042456 [Glycine max]KRH12115.1 hypothetical protein GLYMA_15G153200v4 [Glycine max]
MLALFFLKPLATKYWTTRALGMILLSKLNPKISGFLARAKESQPNCLTQNLITRSILSWDANIKRGCLLNIPITNSSDQPQLLKTSTLASQCDFGTIFFASSASPNFFLKGSNPISLISSKVSLKPEHKITENLFCNKKAMTESVAPSSINNITFRDARPEPKKYPQPRMQSIVFLSDSRNLRTNS